MRTIYTICFPFWLLIFSLHSVSAQLILTGIIDGPLPQGEPKAVELYVTEAIADLSIYGLRSATNGAGPGTIPEFTFPSSSVSAGDYLYVARDEDDFFTFFGFYPDFEDNLIGSQACNFNGNDAIELFRSDTVIDVYGEVSQDGTGESWEYTDSWVYRKVGRGPSGDTFLPSEWEYAGVDALDGESSNASAASAFPFSTYAGVLGPQWQALEIQAYGRGIKISWRLEQGSSASAIALEYRSESQDWIPIVVQRLAPGQEYGCLVDAVPQTEEPYYRLRLITGESMSFLSPQLSYKQEERWELSLRAQELYLEGVQRGAALLSYRLLDVSGRLIVSGQAQLRESFPWYTRLPSGYYQLSISTAGQKRQLAFIKP